PRLTGGASSFPPVHRLALAAGTRRRHLAGAPHADGAAHIPRGCIMTDTSLNRKRPRREDREAPATDEAKPAASGSRARRRAVSEGAISREEPRADWGLDLDAAPAHDAELEEVARRLLTLIGEDPEREGLVKTPQRVANSLLWLTRGYEQD